MSRFRKRHRPDENDAVGQDSFLDIMSNIVGILIILVMVACARVQSFQSREPPGGEQSVESPQPPLVVASPSLDQPERDDLSSLLPRIDAVQSQRRRFESLYANVIEMNGRIQQFERESALRAQERDRLALGIAHVQASIEEHRADLDGQSRIRFDKEREIAEAKLQLEQLENAISQVANRAPEVTHVLQNYPTPLSRPVDNREVHFRIMQGRVAEVPMEYLVQRVEGQLRGLENQLRSEGRAGGVVGPIGGFRMMYGLGVLEGSRIVMTHATFTAESPELGEPVDGVLQFDSRFMQSLAGYDPKTTTVTLWVYPDSFDAHNAIRTRLYEMGYVVATRPQNATDPIRSSILGSKSAGQ